MTGSAPAGATARADVDPIAVADQVVELVRARAASAEVEVTVRHGDEALTRFANGFIHQNIAEESQRVVLRVAIDGRSAGSSSEQFGPEGLARLVDDVLEVARSRPPDPDWPGLADPAPVVGAEHWDDATAAPPPDERARRVRAFVDAAGGLETAGSCLTVGAAVAFANSAGQRVAGRTTVAGLSGIARTATSDGSARDASVRLDALDGTVLGGRAAEKARTAADPTDLEPGRYEVVLEPQCVANMLEFLFLHGFNGRAVHEGRSFVHLGEAQFDPSITLADDATDPGQVGILFDAEGTPKRRVEVVRAGITSGVLHTRRTARRAGAESTGNATAAASQWGAVPANVVLAAGDRPTSELVAGLGRGLLVTDFWYTRILDPKTQVVTGLTRNGVWLVEDGHVVRPVRNLRFTQSFHEALAPGAVRAVGSERTLITDGPEAAYLVPAVHLASWNFTGGARG
jgi:predicted Zn-dependent protease